MALTRAIGLFVVVVLATGAVHGGDLAGIGQPPARQAEHPADCRRRSRLRRSGHLRGARHEDAEPRFGSRARACVLTDFYANAPVCTPTRAGLISGRYQQRVRLERPMSRRRRASGPRAACRRRVAPFRSPEDHAGYATALIGKWHLGFGPDSRAEAPWVRTTSGDTWPAISTGRCTLVVTGSPIYGRKTPVDHQGYLGHETTRRAVRFIGNRDRAPFFLELAYGAPHWPFQSPTAPSPPSWTTR